MYKITKSDGTIIYNDCPTWAKYSEKYASFIACDESGAECILLQEDEESHFYNIAVQKYPQFDVVTVEKIGN